MVAPVIKNNTVRNTGVFAGMGWRKANDGVFYSINSGTPGTLVENNTVINSGYIGIVFNGDSSAAINNYVDTFCLNKDDGGGIYIANSSNKTRSGIIIDHNIVLNGIGAPEGTNSPNTSAHGIYADDYSNGITIECNTVANSTRGIFLHDARNIIVRNNTAYNNLYAFYTQADALNAITNCEIVDNIFFATSRSQYTSTFIQKGNDINGIGTFDNNYYCRPIYEPDGITSTSSSAGGVIRVAIPASTYYSLDAWKKAYGKDPKSKKTATTVSDADSIDFKYNETNDPKTYELSGKWIGVDGTNYSGTATLAPHSSVILIAKNARRKHPKGPKTPVKHNSSLIYQPPPR